MSVNQKLERDDYSLIKKIIPELYPEAEPISRPEKDPNVPKDAHIDGIFKSRNLEIHIEHTSVDLIFSDEKNKRSLDPAFIAIEEALEKAALPSKKGIYLGVPIEAAKDIKRVKSGISELLNELKAYLEITDSTEWEKDHHKPVSILANGINFEIRPKLNETVLHWIAGVENFLAVDQFECKYTELITSKINKLSKSKENSLNEVKISVLILENSDIGAKDIHCYAGEIAKILNKTEEKCDEVWGYTDYDGPMLLWCKELDKGITYNIFSHDLQGRNLQKIIEDRKIHWKNIRNTQIY